MTPMGTAEACVMGYAPAVAAAHVGVSAVQAEAGAGKLGLTFLALVAEKAVAAVRCYADAVAAARGGVVVGRPEAGDPPFRTKLTDRTRKTRSAQTGIFRDALPVALARHGMVIRQVVAFYLQVATLADIEGIAVVVGVAFTNIFRHAGPVAAAHIRVVGGNAEAHSARIGFTINAFIVRITLAGVFGHAGPVAGTDTGIIGGDAEAGCTRIGFTIDAFIVQIAGAGVLGHANTVAGADIGMIGLNPEAGGQLAISPGIARITVTGICGSAGSMP